MLSHQVKADFNSLIKAVTCTLSIITLGVILNYIFHTDNFGMDPYGSASIYMLDIFGSFLATLVAYYFGVVLVLIVGMQWVAILDRITARFFDGHTKAESAEIGDNHEER